MRATSAGITSATVARYSITVAEPADSLLNFWRPCFTPPMKHDSPNTRSRLPMMLPVIEALTISVWWARRATMAMISSAALPNVALRNPPSVGPDRRARCSVADPMRPAAGTSDTAAVTKTHIETPLCQRNHRLIGAATRSRFSQLPVTIRSNWVAGDGMRHYQSGFRPHLPSENSRTWRRPGGSNFIEIVIYLVIDLLSEPVVEILSGYLIQTSQKRCTTRGCPYFATASHFLTARMSAHGCEPSLRTRRLRDGSTYERDDQAVGERKGFRVRCRERRQRVFLPPVRVQRLQVR